ncbi:hypothetical protein YB2330_000030 [Saitoella coloradoensis]
MQLITAFTSTSCLFPLLSLPFSLPHPFSATSTSSSPTSASSPSSFSVTTHHHASRCVFGFFTLPLRLAYSASTLPFRVIRAAGAVLEGEDGDAWLEADLGDADEDVEGDGKEKALEKKARFRGVDIFRKQLSEFRFSSSSSLVQPEPELDVCWNEIGCMTLLPSDFVHLGAPTQFFVDQCWAELRHITLSARDCKTSTSTPPTPKNPSTSVHVIDSTTAVHHAPYALSTSPISESSSDFASAEISSLSSSDVLEEPVWGSDSDSERSEVVIKSASSEMDIRIDTKEVEFGLADEIALVLERGVVEMPVTPFLRPLRAAAAEVDLELISPMTSIPPSTLIFTPALSSLPALTSASASASASEVKSEAEPESHSVPWFDPTLPQFRPSSVLAATPSPSLTLDIPTSVLARPRSAKRHVESALNSPLLPKVSAKRCRRGTSLPVLETYDYESFGVREIASGGHEREQAPMSLKGLMGFAGLGLQPREEKKRYVQKTVKEMSVIDRLLEDLRITPLRRKTKSTVWYKDADVCILGPCPPAPAMKKDVGISKSIFNFDNINLDLDLDFDFDLQRDSDSDFDLSFEPAIPPTLTMSNSPSLKYTA